MKHEYQALLDFWFATARDDPQAAEKRSAEWFGASAEFDARLTARYAALWEDARAGRLLDWAEQPAGRLALILLLDQLSRNLGRGTAAAFGQDEQAAALTIEGLEMRVERGYTPSERGFFLMPLQHAEDVGLQERSVREFRRLHEEAPQPWYAFTHGMLEYAEEHRDIVQRFGRFPHRNVALGRTSTAEEARYLDAGAPRYGQ
ncbi:hypothetical protein CAI21_11385 [Alkalilimnicola ehrlichii]|uniref:Transmembrane protein n=1 Tax=Alkalilimnicola ehrlichii TaxID=351052 RepID=A0A3E0X2A8_9GAMM|nr:DUF924 family protein [Alkalilimnicola ehrlichii]RFA29040.1 hypothetical protein CAI21_11385 [Alkalilimnicola ehrlichii]RFA38678.1 hypothetical protein CAL65_04945 [Alkalilimnicola ehrlichii]